MLLHLTTDQLARAFTALMLALLGGLQIVRPGCFWGMSMYFAGARSAFDPEQRARLARAIAARSDVEGDTDAYTRYAGIFTIAMAPVEILAVVPYVLPYAAAALATAIAMLASYLHFRRAPELRIAPLVRRSVWAALPPAAIVAAAVCVFGAVAFAALPSYRVGALIVVLAAIALCAIAWRVAVAPALLIGDDPQLEYLIDEHVRFCRATSLIALACAPPTVLVLLAAASLPATAHFFNTVSLAVTAAFLVSMVVSLNPIRKRISLA